MARTNTLGNFLTDVANAIREKNPNAPTPLSGADFDTRILEIETGGTGGGSVALPREIYNYNHNSSMGRYKVDFSNLTNMYISASQYVLSSNGKVQLVNKATGAVTEIPSGGMNLAATVYLHDNNYDTNIEELITVQKTITVSENGSFSWTWGTEAKKWLATSANNVQTGTDLFCIKLRDYWLLVNTATPVATFASGLRITRTTTTLGEGAYGIRYQDSTTPVIGPALPPGNYFLLDKLGAGATFHKQYVYAETFYSNCAADPAYVV